MTRDIRVLMSNDEYTSRDRRRTNRIHQRKHTVQKLRDD